MVPEKWKRVLCSARVRAVGAAAAALTILSFAVLTAFTSAGKSSADETQYKETAVARGDIIVGVTESGTATIQAVPVAFDEITVASASSGADSSTEVTATVQKLFVKAGQEVREGDPIAQLSTDGFADTLEELYMDLEKARISLQSARLDQELKAIEAANTLRENQSKETTADLQYQITLKQLETELATSELSLEELQDKIADYEDQLDGDILEDYDLAGLESDYDDACDELDYLLDLQDEGYTIGGSASLTSQIATARQAVSAAKKAWNSAYEQYEDAVASAKSQLKSLSSQYEQKALEYDAAQAKRELSELDAEAQKEQDLTTADNAGALYSITMEQMQNSIASQELSVQTVEKKIAALEKYRDADGMLYAPCSGLVMSVGYEEGDATGWSSAIATIANSKNVYLYVSIAQEDISAITLGKSCDISLGAYEDRKYSGSVDSITVTPARSDSSTVSYAVKVRLDGAPTDVYEGMTGDVTFITKEISDVLYVSNRAVTAENGLQYVLTRDENGEVVRKQVETGFSDGRNVEVTSGLGEGDTVLIASTVTAK